MLRELRLLILVPGAATLLIGCDQPVAQRPLDLQPRSSDAAETAFQVEWDQTIYGVGTAEQPYFMASPPDQQIQFSFESDASEEVEYEPDTGARACPQVLRSNVSFNVRINAVGDRWFTFYAPHTRMAYLGRGKYRYRMSHGFSDDDYWSAEGPWVGYCIGNSRSGIGIVTGFEGTLSARRTGPPPGTGGCTDEEMTDHTVIYDPYEPMPSPSECNGGSGGAGEFDPSNPPTDEQLGVEFECVSYTLDDGTFYMKCTRIN